MKTINIMILLGIFSIVVKAQCDLKYTEQKINEIALKYQSTFLKDFKADLNDYDTAKYSLILSKNTHYRFHIIEEEHYKGNGLFTLYDDSVQIGSTGQFNYYDFKCQKTAIYHIFLINTSKTRYCGTGVLTFVKEINNEE